MEKEKKSRCHNRVPAEFTILLKWVDECGAWNQVEARGVDVSKSGARVMLREPIPTGTAIRVDAPKFNVSGTGNVRYCTRKGNLYSVGIQFSPEAASTVNIPPPPLTDHYEALQVSPNADQATIHRVYRILAARFHPDNTETGDAERFRRLSDAYQVLGDPARRGEYDANYSRQESKPLPVFEMKEFVRGLAGEVNRRLGILCLLYNQRRYRLDTPGLSVLQLETLMAFPREHLNFTLWYLRERKLVTVVDNSDCALTSAGVDYLEANALSNPLVERLLDGGTNAGAPAGEPAGPGPATDEAAGGNRLLLMRHA
jgi:DnaJ-domain-containing protein 1